MIDTVISDLGKVIVWFDNRIFYKKIAGYTSFPEDRVRDIVRAHWNLIELFDIGELTSAEFHARAVQALDARIGFEDFFAIYNDVFSLNPPALELLQKLKPRCTLVLCSNTDVMRFSFIKEKFPEILIFDEYVLSFEVGFMKPHPQIYAEALKRARSEAQRAVFIDDMEENIQAAENAGIRGILFSSAAGLEKELRHLGLSF
ncbi:MAG: HAD family phosphatase [Candidatus Aminicenantales bacterium]